MTVNNFRTKTLFSIKKTALGFGFWIIALALITVIIFYYKWQDWFPWFWAYFIAEFNYRIIGLPLLIPFVCASVLISRKFALIIWCLSLLAILPCLVYYHTTNPIAVLFNITFLLAPLILLTSITSEYRWHEEQKNIVAEQKREREIFTSKIIQAHEDERRRITQELHDEAIQELIVLANSAQMLASNAKRLGLDELQSQSEWLRDRILALNQELRRMSRDLRPSVLDDIGLVPALRWLVNRQNSEAKINAKIRVDGEIKKLKPDTELAVFRVIQEALNNVKKHSQGAAVLVGLKFSSDSLKITVEDNGNGFAMDVLPSLVSEGKLGIIGMEQRAKSINSKFKIKSSEGKGTTITIELPFKGNIFELEKQFINNLAAVQGKPHENQLPAPGRRH